MTKPIAPLIPCIESESVKSLLKKISSDSMPFYISCQPNQSDIENECFSLVDNYIQAHGGERINGWALWEQPNLYIEAEFHAIWKSPEGNYLDLNPRQHKTVNILFLPQLDLTYEGFQRNNIRLPLTNNKSVHNFLKFKDYEFEFNNRGNRKGMHGEVYITDPAEIREYDNLMRTLLRLGIEINQLIKPLTNYDPCICGSGKKAKWCQKLK
ncbi:TPA: hypothetical protein RHI22_001694 [Acinetobacter baumannii]|uniref:hypothetical protein n=1 Tax=Acinetobacter baumannii TaxID=470 RepID=UPI0006286638|nr:hypothetical protein [Acinetobacter baumannii]EJB8410427.1 hypothetical protein [Acinetobacter baumannii]EKU2731224.1 hypothetical protein [Acinetobacter baumannii]EKU6135874.1 hypothetical protein [Acinetobacter baumannii]EKU9772720.1 hypothetical protein [Acinetobacter baumannii]EKV0044686.1 hypothetical protein [Acinetobacter baumannii]